MRELQVKRKEILAEPWPSPSRTVGADFPAPLGMRKAPGRETEEAWLIRLGLARLLQKTTRWIWPGSSMWRVWDPRDGQHASRKGTFLALARLVPIVICIAGCLAKGPAPGNTGANPWKDISFEPFFRGYQGCFVVYDLDRDASVRFNPTRCAERFPPCSTFKIPNSLIGLEIGVLKNESTFKKWDGTPKMFKSRERDHDLASAIRYSVVWYFQEVARDIGPERMQHYLKRFDYGNQDISGGIDRFWLGNSLKISADEQIRFLAKLYRDRLPVGDHAREVTQKILILETKPGYSLSGKTGSDWDAGDWVLGWFVGYLRSDKGRFIFALNISDGPDSRGFTAKAKAIEILKAMALLGD